MTLLIGSYTGGKGSGTGITVADGDRVVATVAADSPSWLARHPALPVLYAVAETDDGQVRAWRLDGGVPAEPLGSGETGGAEPAHLAVDPSGRFLVTANYTGGSISVHELGPDGALGDRTDLVAHHARGEHPRQESAHPHMVCPAGGELLVADLGADAIYRYRLTPAGKLEELGIVAAPPGSGPRHILPAGTPAGTGARSGHGDPDWYYVTAELSGQVLTYGRGWQLAGAVAASTRPGPNQPSELAAGGGYLYVACRGPDTVAVFSLGGGIPAYVTEVAAGGWPRHIALDGRALYIASERSHEVRRLQIDPDTGIPAAAAAIGVPSPTVVLP